VSELTTTIIGACSISTVIQPPPVISTTLSIGQGPAGVSGGEFRRDLVVAQALGGHRVVALVASGIVDYADPSNAAHINRVLGITTGAVDVGEPAEIRLFGTMTEPGWSWTLGADLYLGVAGQMTHDLSAPGAVFLQRVATAVTATEVLIDLSEPILFED
jgi:hypothetical protein